jgi:predicted DNA-binding mobile mystery protein A
MKHPRSPRQSRQMMRQLDELLAGVDLPLRPAGGWVSAIREALSMSQAQLARRMGISRQNLRQLEQNEASHAATLARVRRAADALDCDLQYVLVPRRSLAQLIKEQATRRAHQKLGRVNQSQALEAAALSAGSLSDAVADLATELEVLRPSDLWND